MAAEHFFAKAWSLSFERFSQKIRDFLKNLLLTKEHFTKTRLFYEMQDKLGSSLGIFAKVCMEINTVFSIFIHCQVKNPSLTSFCS